MAGVDELRKIIRAAVFAIAIAFVVVALYFGAYFCVGQRWAGGGTDPETGRPFEVQAFHSEWQAKVFMPAAAAESFLSKKDVNAVWINK